jgi:putative PIN family toxin of toxin-antitoxin system
LVLDTDVIVAAMRSPTGASAAVLMAARHQLVTLLLTVPLAVEYEHSCKRLEHQLAAGLSLRQVDLFLDAIVAASEAVQSRFLWRPQLRDPDDEMVLEAAVNGRAKALVTFNIGDFGAAPSRFGIEVIRPGEVMRRLRQ